MSRQAQLPRKTKKLRDLLAVRFLLSVLGKPGPAFLHCVKGVVGNCRNDVVQIGIDDEPKHNVRIVRSPSHPIFHNTIAFENALSMR